MALEDIFRNKRGIYQRDSKTGIYTIKEVSPTPKVVIGSVNPNVTISRLKLDQFNSQSHAVIIMDGLISGHVNGFLPDLLVGNRPLSLVCNPSDIQYVGNDQMAHTLGKNYQIELGAQIIEVYRKIPDEEIDYEIRRI